MSQLGVMKTAVGQQGFSPPLYLPSYYSCCSGAIILIPEMSMHSTFLMLYRQVIAILEVETISIILTLALTRKERKPSGYRTNPLNRNPTFYTFSSTKGCKYYSTQKALQR